MSPTVDKSARPNLADSLLESIKNWVGGAVILAVVVGVPVGGYQSANENGYISHDYDTPAWIQGDWLVGEYRQCQMRTKTVPGQMKDLDSLNRLPRLFCAEDANGLFDFQQVIEPLSHPTPPPPERSMYFIGVTGSEHDHEFHTMPVRYHGRIDRSEEWVISWRCQRKSESLACWALN